jgi:multiple sugar transport system substrate-binding protein
MKLKFSLSAIVMAGALASSPLAADPQTIEVGYPYSALFDVTFERIMPLFNAKHPDITVKFRASYDNYEDATQTILREAVSGNTPDVTLQGLNRQAILVEKGIAKSLDPYIDAESDFAKDGYHQAMLDLSTFDGGVYALPFSVSLPVGYYNVTLLNSVGIDTLPATWDEVITNCKILHKAGYKNPLFWGWNITGNWFFQALMWSQGEPILKDGKVNFDGEAGLIALETMHSLFRECNMLNLNASDAGTPFASGSVAMYYWSTSAVGAVERTKGEFEMVTNEYPGIGGPPLGLPAGGNAVIMSSTSDDPEHLAASWAFIKFITSGEGAAVVAETTGYMPPNKAANALLGDFYAANPAKQTAVRQAGLLRDWIAYPGEQGLAITQVIYDYLESIVIGDVDDMKALQAEMSAEVTSMLPK